MIWARTAESHSSHPIAPKSQEYAVLNFDILGKTPVATEPFPYMAAANILDASSLDEIAAAFPLIEKPGIFPLSELDYGEAFARLIEDIQGARLEGVMSEKFGIDLSDKPLMVTVRGHCQKKDGRIHTDSKDKLVTCLLYLNAPQWKEEGGCLRLLRNGGNLTDMIAEVPPNGGSFVAFKRTDNSWHGHAPFVGQRRYVMFNWVRSEVALAKNLGRHKLSAVFKRLGLIGG
jgi:hypothetical protein